MEQVQGMSLPEGNLKGGNCGVTAVAVAAQVSFGVAMKAIADIRTGLPIGSKKRWAHPTTKTDRERALIKLGVNFVEIWNITKTVSPSPGVVRLVKNRSITIENWVLYGLSHNEEKLYMVTTTRHVQMVLGKYVMDQSGAIPVSKYWGRNKRITNILEIVR